MSGLRYFNGATLALPSGVLVVAKSAWIHFSLVDSIRSKGTNKIQEDPNGYTWQLQEEFKILKVSLNEKISIFLIIINQ